MRIFNTKYLFFVFVFIYVMQEDIYAEEYYGNSKDAVQTYKMLQDNDDFQKTTNGISDENGEFRLHFLKNIFKNISLENVNKECKDSLIIYFNDLMSLKPWAVEMFDATGKPSSGILQITAVDAGSFEDCLRIRAPSNDDDKSFHFKGQYCMVHLQHPLFQPPRYITEHGRNYYDAFGLPPNWAKELFDALSSRFGQYLGICIPSSCTKQDLYNIIVALDEPATLNVTLTDCTEEEEESKKWPISAKIAIVVLSIFLLLNATGTLLDLKESKQPEENNTAKKNVNHKILKSFSIPRNVRKLFTINPKKGNMDFIHGIRILSCFWTVIGHKVFYPTLWKEVYHRGIKEAQELFKPGLLLVFLDNGLIIVEVFFCIGGFLLVYLLWPEIEKTKGRINIWGIIAIRYLRLTPVYLFVLIIPFFFPLLNSGPFWESEWEYNLGNCLTNGWKNVLYINNFDDIYDVCWMHSWYIAVTMQFTIVSIPLMILVYKYPKFGILVCIIMIIGSILNIYYASIATKQVFIVYHSAKINTQVSKFISTIYMKPFFHISSNVIGMFLGWVILKYKNPKLRKVWLRSGWILCSLGYIIALYAPYYPTENERKGALYNSTRNVFYTTSLSWIIFSCINGYGGVIDRLLSWKALVPLSRISYSVYLVHPLLLAFRDASLTERIMLDKLSVVIESIPFILLSIIFGFVIFIMVEEPCSRVISLLTEKRTSVEKNTSPPIQETTDEN